MWQFHIQILQNVCSKWIKMHLFFHSSTVHTQGQSPYYVHTFLSPEVNSFVICPKTNKNCLIRSLWVSLWLLKNAHVYIICCLTHDMHYLRCHDDLIAVYNVLKVTQGKTIWPFCTSAQRLECFHLLKIYCSEELY